MLVINILQGLLGRGPIFLNLHQLYGLYLKFGFIIEFLFISLAYKWLPEGFSQCPEGRARAFCVLNSELGTKERGQNNQLLLVGFDVCG